MFVGIIFVLLFGCAFGNEEDFRKLDCIRSERPCLSAGGMCVIADDCPKGFLTEKKGLCPAQKSKGVECCYGLSVKETRCQKRGGQCMPSSTYCNPSLTYAKATDCETYEKCCILV